MVPPYTVKSIGPKELVTEFCNKAKLTRERQRVSARVHLDPGDDPPVGEEFEGFAGREAEVEEDDAEDGAAAEGKDGAVAAGAGGEDAEGRAALDALQHIGDCGGRGTQAVRRLPCG